MSKKIIDRIIGGLGIAFVITNIMMLIYIRDQSGLNTIFAYIIWMIAGILYGLISLIHDIPINRWLCVLLHYVATISVSYTAITVMFYQIFKIEPAFNFLLLLPIFSFIYFCVAASTFIYEKITINALNKKLSGEKK